MTSYEKGDHHLYDQIDEDNSGTGAKDFTDDDLREDKNQFSAQKPPQKSHEQMIYQLELSQTIERKKGHRKQIDLSKVN